MTLRNLMLQATILATGALIALPAAAQTTPAVAAANDVSDGIEDIVVTAQKRTDTIQSLPLAVSAIDQKGLESATIKDIRDVAARIPSLVVDNVGAGPSAAAISIRGISFEDIEKSFDPAVGVVVDGVFIGTNTGQLLDSFDMERLEVLRGPQGTLFGRNTIGGVINVTRTRPSEEFGVRGSASYGNYDTKRGRLVLNSGKLGDLVALKGFVFYDDTDGFLRNVTKNRREGAYETLTGGVSALFTPTDGISALITYEHLRERGETAIGSLSATGKDVLCIAPGAPNFGAVNQCNRLGLPSMGLYTTFENAPQGVRNDTDSITANVDVELGENFTLSSVTGYRTNDELVQQDFDATSTDFFSTSRAQDYEQFSQELRIVGDVNDMLNLLGGVYYFDSNYQNDQTTRLGPLATGGAPAFLRQYVDHSTKSYAAFADARVRFSEEFSIGVGARYTEDKKSIFNNYGRVPALVALSQPTFNGRSCVQVVGLLAPGVPAYGPATNCTGSKTFDKLTYRANAEYKLGTGKLAYVSYSRGYRSGGFNGRASSPTTLGPYEPEVVDAYEIGLKADWLDRTLRTNFAVYQTDYNNKQEEIVQPSPPGSASPQETVVQNAATARIRGAEVEVIAQITDGFSFRASGSYTDAKFRDFFNDVVGLTPGSAPDLIPDDVSSLTLRRAPKYQWSAGIDYSRDLGSGTIDFSTTLRFQDKYQTCIAPARPRIPGNIVNDERCETEAREDLQAQIGYTFNVGDAREVKVSVFGRNLTDQRGLSSTLPVAGLFTFGAAQRPRTYGVEVGFKF